MWSDFRSGNGLNGNGKKQLSRSVSCLDMAISRPKTWSYCINGTPCAPNEVFLWASSFLQVSRSIGYKNWGKWEKSQEIDLSGIHGHFDLWKIWSKSSILVLFGSLVGHSVMQSCFWMFVCVFQAIRGVKNDLNQNMSFPPDIYKVNEALNDRTGCDP